MQASLLLHPLKIIPLMKQRVWGGNKLLTVLHKQAEKDHGPYGESWELADFSQDSNSFDHPQLGNHTFHSFHMDPNNFSLWAGDILKTADGNFPWLLKFIDAQETLSVQVHPDEQACLRLPGAQPKTEAWYIVDAEPDSFLYLGIKPGLQSDDLQAAITNQTLEELLVKVPVKAGELYFIPAGTIHAIGSGILLAEVQQTSDTTYRVYDWGRMGLDGQPRQLHIQEALASTNFLYNTPHPLSPPRSGLYGHVCPFFTMEIVHNTTLPLLTNQTAIAMCTKGNVTIVSDHSHFNMDIGQTVILPSMKQGWQVKAQTGQVLMVTQHGLQI